MRLNWVIYLCRAFYLNSFRGGGGEGIALQYGNLLVLQLCYIFSTRLQGVSWCLTRIRPIFFYNQQLSSKHRFPPLFSKLLDAT